MLNGIDPSAQYFCKGDARRWLERFARQGRTFHGIILDPPTFSRDDRGKVFRVESHYGELVALARECLEPGGCCAPATAASWATRTSAGWWPVPFPVSA